MVSSQFLVVDVYEKKYAFLCTLWVLITGRCQNVLLIFYKVDVQIHTSLTLPASFLLEHLQRFQKNFLLKEDFLEKIYNSAVVTKANWSLFRHRRWSVKGNCFHFDFESKTFWTKLILAPPNWLSLCGFCRNVKAETEIYHVLFLGCGPKKIQQFFLQKDLKIDYASVSYVKIQ